jgi:hypothetical protein
VDINIAWETVRENIKISAKESLDHYELKCKPWFDEGCSKLFVHKKYTKFQLLQHPSKINFDNLNNIRHEASRHFKNKKKENPKHEINELALNIKHKNIRGLYRGINEF